jgi:hypothetical protein
MFETLDYNEALELGIIDEEALRFDNPSFDSAIVAVDSKGRLVYSYSAMVEELIIQDNMSEEEAVDFIGYNTLRSLDYCGSMAPVVIMEGITYNKNGISC